MSFDRIAALTDNKAETYTFSEEERTRILFNAEEAGLKWADNAGDGKINNVKKLEQMRKKEINLTLHASTLTEYLKAQRIPRGLRCSLTPILLKDDAEYQSKWYALCNRHSLDLMLLTVKHLQVAIKKTQDEISTILPEVKNSSTPAEFDKLQEEISVNIRKMREQLMQTKIKKFERDTKDYLFNRVYTWSEEKKPRWRPHGKERKTQYDTSSDTSGAGAAKMVPKYKAKGKNKKQDEKTQEDLFLDAGDQTSSGEQSSQSDRPILRSKTKKTT